jgi:hypothetical protein
MSFVTFSLVNMTYKRKSVDRSLAAARHGTQFLQRLFQISGKR